MSASDLTIHLPQAIACLQGHAPHGYAPLKAFLAAVCSRPPIYMHLWKVDEAVMQSFALALFERKWGSQERAQAVGPAPTNTSVIDPLAPVVDALIKYLRVQPLSSVVIDSLLFVAGQTAKPYVRDQTFKFFFDWALLDLAQLSRHQRIARLHGHRTGASECAVSGADLDFEDAAEDSGVSDSMLRMITAGLTDVW